MGIGENICRLINGLGQDVSFTQKDIVDKHGESWAIPVVVKSLVARGALRLVSEENARPQRYVIHGDVLKLMCDNGDFSGLYRSAKKNRKPRVDHPRVAELESECESLRSQLSEGVEIDPMDFFDQLEPDDFSALVGAYLHNQRSITEPMRVRLAELTQKVSSLQNERDTVARSLYAEIDTLKMQLSNAHKQINDLEEEIAGYREKRIMRESPVKTLIIEKRGTIQRDSGGHGGKPMPPVIVHRKPRVDHVPASVRDRIGRK